MLGWRQVGFDRGPPKIVRSIRLIILILDAHHSVRDYDIISTSLLGGRFLHTMLSRLMGSMVLEHSDDMIEYLATRVGRNLEVTNVELVTQPTTSQHIPP